jgi:hypothetical protein
MAGLLAPFRGDGILAEEKRCQLDRLYQRITDDLLGGHLKTGHRGSLQNRPTDRDQD